jgi:hypothetical protein
MKRFCSKSQSGEEKNETRVIHCALSWRFCSCTNGGVDVVDAQVSVIGHGIGGKVIPAKMAQLTES